MTYVYAASYMARRSIKQEVILAHKVDVIYAGSEEEAIGIALLRCGREWPDRAGWMAHDVRLMLVLPPPEHRKENS